MPQDDATVILHKIPVAWRATEDVTSSLACFHMYSLSACNILAQVTRQGCLQPVAHAQLTESTPLSQTNASVITLRYELNGTPILTERVAPKGGL